MSMVLNKRLVSLKQILKFKQHTSEVIKGTTSVAPAVIPPGVTTTYNKPKLPKLTTSQFNGELTAQTTFWDTNSKMWSRQLMFASEDSCLRSPQILCR